MAGHSRCPVGLRGAAAPVAGRRPGGQRRFAAAPAPSAALVREKRMRVHRRLRAAATGYHQVHVLRRTGKTKRKLC